MSRVDDAMFISLVVLGAVIIAIKLLLLLHVLGAL